MKIKEICVKTGLTDRTVRYYIEEGLISPVYTENYLGRKSFDFSEEDLERLKSIATLRSFGFSVEEIKKLTFSEKSSRELVQALRQRSEESLSESRRRLDVLSALKKSDDADLSKLAEELESYEPEVLKKRKARKRILCRSLILLTLLCLPIGVIFAINRSVSCKHEYETYQVLLKASCRQDGEEILKCSACGKLETKRVEKLPHNPIIIPAVAATCKKTGQSEGSRCSLCREVLTQPSVIPIKEHDYQRKEIAQSCGVDGCILFFCTCGDSYKTDVKPATSRHDFERSANLLDFFCRTCNLKVIAHGNADGTISGGNDNVKYYVTGNLETHSDYEIVVYGNGDMHDYSTNDRPPWYSYLSEAKSITVKDGISSIGDYAFYTPDPIATCHFSMPDSIKTIGHNAIKLKIPRLVLGSGVETIKSGRFDEVGAIYLPKTLRQLPVSTFLSMTTAVGATTKVCIYEGSLDELYKIQLTQTLESQSLLEYIETLDEWMIDSMHIYIEAEDISDRDRYWR